MRHQIFNFLNIFLRKNGTSFLSKYHYDFPIQWTVILFSLWLLHSMGSQIIQYSSSNFVILENCLHTFRWVSISTLRNLFHIKLKYFRDLRIFGLRRQRSTNIWSENSNCVFLWIDFKTRFQKMNINSKTYQRTVFTNTYIKLSNAFQLIK